jgi:hypothetical protein
MAARRHAACAIRPIASASTSTRRDPSRHDGALGTPRNARFPAIEAEGELVATAIATPEIGVPTPTGGAIEE